ncbi:MAG: LysR family transcriptional regulator [Pseudomonadota bacterium]
MDWDKLRIFHAAAEAGSFTHAGDALDMSQSAVSRQVSSLEKELNIILFHRHARGLILTEQGELLFRTAHDVFTKLESVETRLADSKTKPSGDLRVTTTLGLGSHWLTPRLLEFTDLYPDINLQLLLNDTELDIAMREADVAIWLREPTQNDLVRRKLFTVHLHVYASISYIKRHGTPKTLEDLVNHKYVTFGGNIPTPIKDLNWLEDVNRKFEGQKHAALSINSIYGIRRAVKSGIGLGVLPDYLVEEDNDIVPVLQNADVPQFNTYFVYPEELRNLNRINIFRDFLLKNAKVWSF